MVVMGLILMVAVLAFGVLFLRLHSLPERIAHRSHKIQFEIVAVLCLIALFTHIHLFWIAALLLALIDIPDFAGSLGRIAGSVEKMAGVKPGDGAADVPGDALFSGEPVAADGLQGKPAEAAMNDRDRARENVAALKRSDGTAPVAGKPGRTPASTGS
jgi:multisubunit Na+/H+ antiporter MnhF subunit